MSGALFFDALLGKKKKRRKIRRDEMRFGELQTGQHGRVVLIVQIGTHFAGLDTAVVDRREDVAGAADHSSNKENRHHKKGLAFRILQDG